jgi:hypothetical protein
MKQVLLALAAAAALATGTQVIAGTLPQANLYQLCAAGKAANNDGISAKYLIAQMLEGRGQPKYLANVVMNEMKPVCPRVY